MGGAWACPGPHPARTDHTRDGWRHYVFVQHNQGIRLGHTCMAASSDATAAVSQSAHAPTVWLSLISTHTSAHRVTRPAGALSLYSLTLFNLLWLNFNLSEGCQVQCIFQGL